MGSEYSCNLGRCRNSLLSNVNERSWGKQLKQIFWHIDVDEYYSLVKMDPIPAKSFKEIVACFFWKTLEADCA